jgi:NAD(P)-dependent dehydrogenase (short-subunit alcohol dehydrogenase family)
VTNARHWFISGINGGLGLAITQLALSRGDTVSGTVRSERAAAEVASACGIGVRTVFLDASVAASENLPDDIKAELKRCHILVNNIGVGFEGAVEETSVDELRQLLDVNFYSTVALTRAALPSMREAKWGRIVNISSIGGLMSAPLGSGYCTSKFAMEAFTEALAGEVAPSAGRISRGKAGASRQVCQAQRQSGGRSGKGRNRDWAGARQFDSASATRTRERRIGRSRSEPGKACCGTEQLASIGRHFL